MGNIDDISNILEIHYENSILALLDNLNVVTFEDVVDVLLQSSKKDELYMAFYEAQRDIMDEEI